MNKKSNKLPGKKDIIANFRYNILVFCVMLIGM